MTIVLTSTAGSANQEHDPRTPKPEVSVPHRRPWEIAMDTVAALLADPEARLSSPHAISVLRQQIHRVEGTVDASDVRSLLTDTWKALLALAEAGRGTMSCRSPVSSWLWCWRKCCAAPSRCPFATGSATGSSCRVTCGCSVARPTLRSRCSASIDVSRGGWRASTRPRGAARSAQ
jgi:hypothetical protein